MNRRQFAFGSTYTLAALAHLTKGLEAIAQIAPGTHETRVQHRNPAPQPRDAPSGSAHIYQPTLWKTQFVNVKRKIRNPGWASLFEKLLSKIRLTQPCSFPSETANRIPLCHGDIPAMWLRDSSAQVLPYVHLASKDRKLQTLFQGLIYRQAHCILLDSYANAFYATTRSARSRRT